MIVLRYESSEEIIVYMQYAVIHETSNKPIAKIVRKYLWDIFPSLILFVQWFSTVSQLKL